ncbi:acyltransferase [Vibrio tubiashii]|uniref:acyltransferase family protein n=2 Tax=Vibrio tubiashii TaxID=29498 RepID=UPI001EFCD915|nr:acyltransferase [Vibrio tubiashii]MCG9614213.1 acyltransferase [Vibrio tubiashii]
MWINSFNNFRAIAIVFIVAAHSFGISGVKRETFFDYFVSNLIAGGTTLFVFISGYLFYEVFYKNFNYLKFIKKKINNILLPYLFLGIPPIMVYLFFIQGEFDGYFDATQSGWIHEYVIPLVKYYASGRFLPAYWYIPFILLTFLLSPFHVRYANMRLKSQLMVILIWGVVAVLVHRPIENINEIQSFVYFTPVYLIGITSAINKELVYRTLKGKDGYLLAIVVGLAALQASLGQYGNNHKAPFEFAGVDIVLVQKVIMCFFFMIFLHRFEHYSNKLLTTLASTSFSVFFIHPYIIQAWPKLGLKSVGDNSWLAYIMTVVLICTLSVMIGKSVKFVLKKHSRMLVGY